MNQKRLESLRKWSFAIAVFIVICIFAVLKVISPEIFRDILIWIGNGFFLANLGEHWMKSRKRDKEYIPGNNIG